jgi:hypothetical protein
MATLIELLPLSIRNLPWAFIVPMVTYVGGLFSKPFAESVARALDTRRERKRLRDALYRELGENVEKLISRQLMKGHPGGSPFENFDEWERREVYDLALKTQPVLFRELREAKFLNDFYLALRQSRAKDAATQAQHLLNVTPWINYQIKKGELSRRRLKAAFTLYPPFFMHPFSAWCRKQYHVISNRNAPKVTKPGVGYIYDPVDTFPKKLRALWTGVPGKPREYYGPSLVGEQVFGNVFSANPSPAKEENSK